MFERNRIDNAPETNAVPVEVAFADGRAVKGKLLVAMGRSVADALNGTGGFVEFEPYGGERGFLAKAQLTSVRLVGAPKGPTLRPGSSISTGSIPTASWAWPPLQPASR